MRDFINIHIIFLLQFKRINCRKMTIKIYGGGFTTATMRVLACLNEKGLDYEFIAVDMLSGAHRKDPFLSLSV